MSVSLYYTCLGCVCFTVLYMFRVCLFQCWHSVPWIPWLWRRRHHTDTGHCRIHSGTSRAFNYLWEYISQYATRFRLGMHINYLHVQAPSIVMQTFPLVRVEFDGSNGYGTTNATLSIYNYTNLNILAAFLVINMEDDKCGCFWSI